MNNDNQIGAAGRIFLVIVGIAFFAGGLYAINIGSQLISFYSEGSSAYQNGITMSGFGGGGLVLGFLFFIFGVVGKRMGGNKSTYNAPQYNPYNQNQYNNNPTGYTSSYSNPNYNASTTPSTNAPSATDALSKDLKSLADLRDKGLLTEEEYQAKRRKLLDL